MTAAAIFLAAMTLTSGQDKPATAAAPPPPPVIIVPAAPPTPSQLPVRTSTRRGRFEPARDGRGGAIAGSYVSRVRWDLRGQLRAAKSRRLRLTTRVEYLDEE